MWIIGTCFGDTVSSPGGFVQSVSKGEPEDPLLMNGLI